MLAGTFSYGKRCLVRMLGLGVVLLIPACGKVMPTQSDTTSSGSPVASSDSGGGGFIMRAGLFTPEPTAATQDIMAKAEDMYRQERFSEARREFRSIATSTLNPPLIAEKARYYEAECLRNERDYSTAVSTYHRLLQDFPAGVYREQCCSRMFDIANYWLDDTRAEMDAVQEKAEGKRWFIMPAVLTFDPTKPTFDVEGHALKTLEIVHYSDITGPNADKALWLAGYVHFYRGSFREADHYLSQLIEHHKESKLRPQAIELAIMAKNNSTGGSWYDGRKSDEARRLIHQAQSNVPELVAARGDFLDRQLYAINFQQAEKTFNTADFYRRTKHPGSAYFYYDLVRRQYPGTTQAHEAGLRMQELRLELIEAQANGEPGLMPNGWFEQARRGWLEMTGNPQPVVQPVPVPPEPIVEGMAPTPNVLPSPTRTLPTPGPVLSPAPELRSVPKDELPR